MGHLYAILMPRGEEEIYKGSSLGFSIEVKILKIRVWVSDMMYNIPSFLNVRIHYSCTIKLDSHVIRIYINKELHRNEYFKIRIALVLEAVPCYNGCINDKLKIRGFKWEKFITSKIVVTFILYKCSEG